MLVHRFGQARLSAASILAALHERMRAVTGRDWLLILCAYHGAPAGLDPVRLQKAMFLFARSGERPARERYEFRPYHYGPMSPHIYSDLDALVSKGLVEAHEVPGKRWSRYVASDRGRAVAEGKLNTLTREHDKRSAQKLYAIKQDGANVSFNELLERVYREHPDMAVNSVFAPVA